MTTVRVRLDPERLKELMMACFFDPKRDSGDPIRVQVVHAADLHPGRLEEHREEITALLMELPAQFMASSGKGPGAFQAAAFDRHGRNWTGTDLMIETLFLLGLGIGKAEKCGLPGDLGATASQFSGGLPYFLVKDVEPE